jgi:hypothetical protein
VHGTLTLRRPGSGVVLAIFKGPDVGEFGDAPFRELEKDLAKGEPLELFFDAQECPGPSVNVSNEWAQWLSSKRSQLHRVNILSGSRFVEITANFVKRFTALGDRIRVYTDRDAFYQALAGAIGTRVTE